MQKNKIPSSVSAFLSAHGGEALLSNGDLPDLAGIVRVFQSAAPSPESDPLSHENLAYLTALADCVESMDERLYEHYRALIDMFRAGVFRAPRSQLLSYPSWNPLREKGVALGILPGDLYGDQRPVPHVGKPTLTYNRKGVSRS